MVYRNDELIYIGMTTRRWKEHQGHIKKKSNALSVYSLIEDDDKIEFKILFDAMKNGMKEVKAIERKFIHLLVMQVVGLVKQIIIN